MSRSQEVEADGQCGESRIQHLPILCAWEEPRCSLSLGFSICKMETTAPSCEVPKNLCERSQLDEGVTVWCGETENSEELVQGVAVVTHQVRM